MPSTYTLNNGIELIGTGEQSGTWGDTTNTNLSLLDTALDGQVTVTLPSAGTSGSPNTLAISDGAASDGRNRMVIFNDSSDLGATAYVQLTPNDAEKIIYVRNSLSGDRSILLFQGTYSTSNDYELPAGKTAVIFFDGGLSGAVAANVMSNAHFDALNIVGDVVIGGDTTVSGNVSFGINNKARFGTSFDLELYSNGAQSVIQENGSGSLLIRGQDVLIQNAAGTENFFTAAADAETTLYHNGVYQLRTIASGIEVGYPSNSENNITIGQGRTTNGYAYIDMIGDATYTDFGLRVVRDNTGANANSQVLHRGTGGLILQATDAGTVTLKTTSTTRFSVQDGGDIDFYSGGAVAATWDNSEGVFNVGGLTNTTYKVGSSNGFLAKSNADNQALLGAGFMEISKATPFIDFKVDPIDDYDTRIIMTGGTNLEFYVGGSGSTRRALRMDSLGNLVMPDLDANDTRIIGITDASVNSYVPTKRDNLTVQASSALSGAQLMGGADLNLKAGNSNGSTTGLDGHVNIYAGSNIDSAYKSGKIRLYSGGEENVRLTENGNFQIGTYAFDNAYAPIAMLSVFDDLLGQSSGSIQRIGEFATHTGNISRLVVSGYRFATGTDHTSSEMQITHRVDSTDFITLGFRASNTFAIRRSDGTSYLFADGNGVGIGGTTTGVNGTQLTVNTGNGIALGDSSGYLSIKGGTGSSSDFTFFLNNNTGSTFGTYTFQTRNGVTTKTPLILSRLNVKAAGTDDAVFYVQNSSGGASDTDTETWLVLGDAGSTYKAIGQVKTSINTGETVINSQYGYNVESKCVEFGRSKHKFYIGGLSSPIAYIHSTGVAINVDSTQADFIVQASASTRQAVNIRDSSGTNGIVISPDAVNDYVMQVRNKVNGDQLLRFVSSVGNTIGSIIGNTASVAYSTTSDRRLKDNIEPITDGVEKVMAMNPVTHTWKANPSDPAVHGFIAQEMQEVVPEAVSGEDGGEEMMAMDYGRITPVLVAALQDALKEIQTLKDRVSELENK